MSINITSNDVKVIDINGYYIRIIPSRNLISENIIQALGIHWTTWDGLAGIQWIHIDGVCYNFHSFNQLIQMCKIKDVAIPAMLHKYLSPVAAPELPIVVSELATVEKPETMSSLEIADLTGKAHKNVIVDIEKIINELGDELKIQPISYTDKMNRIQKAYNLDRESTLLNKVKKLEAKINTKTSAVKYATISKLFNDYINGKLMHFLEHDGQLYINTDDIEKMLEDRVLH